MPKRIMTSKCRTCGGSKRLDGRAFGQVTRSATGFCRAPLAAVFRYDVIKVGAEDVLEPAGVGIVRVVCGAKVERLPFTGGDICEN